MPVHQIENNLYLVDLDQNLPGFRQFISSWIFMRDGKTILVDPGPSATIPVLKNALNQLNISKPDYILLTHIHIDHAGGTGLLLDDFPDTRVICHPIGIPHMIDPERLWQGSLKVLGEVAKAYGPIAKIPGENLSFPSAIKDENLRIDIFETPGHASHHVCYRLDDLLFAGEVAGVHVAWKNDFYLRIATPPKFIYEVYKNSLNKISDVKCRKVCFGHYGCFENPDALYSKAGKQLELWLNTCRTFLQNGKDAEENIFNELLKTDPCLKYYPEFDADIQHREKYFSLNSIKGMLGYLKNH